MALYRYRAYTRTGDVADGTVEASSLQAAEDDLWDRGLSVLEAREVGRAQVPWWRRELFARADLSAAELSAFTRDLAMLQQAELPIDDALRIQSAQGSTKRLRALSRDLLDDVLGGAHLSEALARRPETFRADYVGMVRAGEMGARTGQVLGELAELIARRLEIRAKITSSLVYPAILMVMAVASTVLILSVLIPAFAPIFAESGRPVPPGIAVLIQIRDSWQEIGGAVLATGVAACLGWQAVRRRPRGRSSVDAALLRLPVFGLWIAQHEVARFARTLAALLKAGVPLLQGLEMTESLFRNAEMSRTLEVAVERVRGGVGLSTGLAAMTSVPPMALNMIAVGEQAGRLDDVLLRIAVMFEAQTRRRMEFGMSLLTPLLTILIASVVGGLIFSVMSAIMSVNDLASQ